MVSVNRVAYLIAGGNTYGNLDGLRAVGGKFDNGSKTWRIMIETHPLNNTKQRKVLEAKLSELEENGVRFTVWGIDGKVRS